MPGIFYRVGAAGTGEVRYMGLNYNGCSGTNTGDQHYVHNLPVRGLPANFGNKIYTSHSLDVVAVTVFRPVRAGSYLLSGGVIHRSGILPGINGDQINSVTDTTFVSTAGGFTDSVGNVKLIRSFSIKCPFTAYFVTTDNNLFENATDHPVSQVQVTMNYSSFQGQTHLVTVRTHFTTWCCQI